MKCAFALGMLFWALGCGGGEEAESRTEQDLYQAIARGDVRYALLTQDAGEAEARLADGELAAYTGVNVEALAAVLSKERVEHFLQATRGIRMPE